MKLPKTIYVRVEVPANDEPYFVASKDLTIDEDGPYEVGTYQLVEKQTVEKVIQVKKR